VISASNAKTSRTRHAALLSHARLIGRTKGIDHTLQRYNIDVITAPADSPYNLLVSAAGYSTAKLPVGYLRYNEGWMRLKVTVHETHDEAGIVAGTKIEVHMWKSVPYVAGTGGCSLDFA
jgi:hypothetical protein